MPWITRGLSEGVVTSRYPARPDGYGDEWRGAVSLVEQGFAQAARDLSEPNGNSPSAGLAALCPTGAIGITDSRLRLDRGRCILCGRCVEARPDLFRFDPSPEVASVSRLGLVVGPDVEEDEEVLAEVRAELARRTRGLRRSVHIRHVDVGSDGSEEWEIAALGNPVYDIHRLGVFFTASPRHADILLATGVGSAGMVGPLWRTFESMPDPKVVIAAGTDAISGGLVHQTYATSGGIGALLPVDVWVPGSPPSPFSLLHGILLAIGLVSERRSPTAPERGSPAAPEQALDAARPDRGGQ